MGARHEKHRLRYQGRDLSGPHGRHEPVEMAHAVKTEHRSLEEAMVGADVFLGVSAKGAVTQEMVQNMGDNPVIFAMANPDPEITPEEAHEVR